MNPLAAEEYQLSGPDGLLRNTPGTFSQMFSPATPFTMTDESDFFVIRVFQARPFHGEFSGSRQEGLHLFPKRKSAEEVLPEGSFSAVQDCSSWAVTTLAASSVVVQSNWSAGHVPCGQERL